jgi:putative hydrolase of HD superfamily
VNDAKYYANRIINLQLELLKLSEIERLIYYPDGKKIDRRENDTEHSYNLAMTAWYLSQYFPELDVLKLLQYSLTHDFVEIHAGDVMAIGRTKKEQQKKDELEKQALNTLKNDWPDFQALTASINDYEAKNTPEAKFIYALDKLMPLILNIISEGKTWKKLNLNRSDIIKNKEEKTKLSPEVHEIWKMLKEKIQNNDSYFNEGSR